MFFNQTWFQANLHNSFPFSNEIFIPSPMEIPKTARVALMQRL